MDKNCCATNISWPASLDDIFKGEKFKDLAFLNEFPEGTRLEGVEQLLNTYRFRALDAAETALSFKNTSGDNVTFRTLTGDDPQEILPTILAERRVRLGRVSCDEYRGDSTLLAYRACFPVTAQDLFSLHEQSFLYVSFPYLRPLRKGVRPPHVGHCVVFVGSLSVAAKEYISLLLGDIHLSECRRTLRRAAPLSFPNYPLPYDIFVPITKEDFYRAMK